jgi:hypothetical protein
MRTDGLPETDRYGLPTLALALPVLLIGAWLAHTTVINHDSAWALYVGQALLEGAQLYQDIIEVNPPLAFALTVPPVWISNIASADPIDVYFYWIFGQIGLSLVVTAAVIRHLPGWRGFWGAGLVLVVLAALVLGAWNQIGQREHLLMIYVTPYLLLAGARSSGVRIGPGLAVLVGAFAAIGFALKPHFLLVPALVELLLLTRSRHYRSLFRPETIAIAAFIAGYWAWMALFMPTYFSRIVPWGLEVYFAYSSPIEQIWLRGELLLLLLAIGFHIVDGRKTELGRTIEILLVAAAATYAIYVIQQKGFAYHLFPLRTLLILIFGFGLLAETRKATSTGLTGRIGRCVPATVQGAMFAAICGWMMAIGSYANGFYEKALPVVQRHSAGGPAYVFGTNVSLGFPLISYSRLETSWRYPTHWLLPGLVRSGNATDEASPARRERLRSIERYVVDGVIEDFERHQPELVLVDVRPNKSYFADMPFDYLSYFLADPRFVPIWAQYRKVAELDEAHLYRRTGGGAE